MLTPVFPKLLTLIRKQMKRIEIKIYFFIIYAWTSINAYSSCFIVILITV